MEEMNFVMTKDGRRKWSVDQKLGVLKELERGVNRGELCRKYNITEQHLAKWKRRLQSGGVDGLRRSGEVVSKDLYLELLRRNAELERALGRMALERDLLKKSFEMKGLRLPEEK
jgi:transposase-like protein